MSRSPDAEKSSKGISRRFARIGFFIIVLVFMGNLDALVDRFLHPEIPYFDVEHLIVGGITILLSILIGIIIIFIPFFNGNFRESEQANKASVKTLRHNLLLITVVVSAVLTVVFLTLNLYRQTEEDVTSLFQEQQRLVANHLADEIKGRLTRHRTEVETFANVFFPHFPSIEAVEPSILNYFTFMEDADHEKISLYDGEGNVIFSTDSSEVGRNYGGSSFFQWAKALDARSPRSAMPLVSLARDGIAARDSVQEGLETTVSTTEFLFTAPLYEGSRSSPQSVSTFAGAVTLRLDLNDLFVTQFQAANNGRELFKIHTWVMDKGGRLLYQSDHPEMVTRNIYKRGATCDQCHLSFDHIERVLASGGAIDLHKAKDRSAEFGNSVKLEFGDVSLLVAAGMYPDDVRHFVRDNLAQTLFLLSFVVFSFFIGAVLFYRNLRLKVKAEEEAKQLREKQVLEDHVRESEDRYHRLVDSSPDAIAVHAEGKIVLANAAAARLMGAEDPEQLLGKSILECVHPDYRESVVRRVRQIMETGAEAPLSEEKFMRLDGGTIDVEAVGIPFDYKGKPAVQVVVRDITERREAEKALQESEKKYRSLIEQSNDGIYLLDEGKFKIINRRFTEMLGITQEEARAPDFSFMNMVASKSRPMIEERMKLVSRGQEPPRRYEFTGLTKDGREIELEASVSYTAHEGRMAVLGILRDLTERKRAEEALRKANEFQKRLLATAATAILTVDAGHHITSINEAFTEVTGYEEEEIIGKHCSILAGYPCKERCELFDGGKGEPIARRQFTIQTKDGRPLTILKNAALIHEENGKTVTGVESFVDVTELIRARQSAEDANRDLKEANQQLENMISYAKEMALQAEMSSAAKSEFLANMSHEIRTPLNGILGFAQLLLEDEGLNDEQRDFVDTIYHSGSSLLKLINDILDFSKIEAGKLDLEIIEFDLLATAENICDLLAQKASERGLELNCFVDPNIQTHLLGDPGRLRQILLNLLGNALKFTEKGEVTLTVKSVKSSDDAVVIRFDVQDTGIGIPENRIGDIFKSFTQADGSTTRKYGGTGLGLAICKRLVEMMGGEIGVESKLGKGSDFHFIVEFELQKKHLPKSASSRFSSLHGLPVLVVDDNATNRRFMVEMLRKWKMRPDAVASGKEALEFLERSQQKGESMGLMLIDGMMPEMDGFQLAERLKQDRKFADTTVIMLTSAGQRGDAARCKKLGIAAYLTKPVKQSDLLDAIQTACCVPCEDARESTLITSHSLRESRRSLRILLAEDNVVNQKLVVRMLEKRGHTVTIAQTGKEALAQLEAHGSQGFDVILMDVQMPEMDGLEATAAIRKQETISGCEIPIVAMTAHAMKGDRERCLEAGMNAYLSKPIQSKELFEVVESIAADSQEAGEMSESKERLSVVTDAFDVDAAMAQVGGDLELFKEIVGIFVEDSEKLLSEIENAISRGDEKALERSAHTLKGSAGNFGAKTAVETALKLELMGRSGQLDDAQDTYLTLEEAINHLKSALTSFQAEEVV